MIKPFTLEKSENITKLTFFSIQIYRRSRKQKITRYYILGIPIWFSRNKEEVDANSNYKEEFLNFFYKLDDRKEFIDIAATNYKREKNDIKLVAFYLPQFHSIPENDSNFGKGFTEWTNVASAKPHFIGHYQPQLPYDVGFYNLNNENIMFRQIELAKKYGIYGFCFYYYWFSGDRLLEKPVLNYLNNKDLDFPYCLMWANEPWTKLWDGGNKELIKAQTIQDDDDEKFFMDIVPFFQDDRYIKINNKPVLMIYRPSFFETERILRFVSKMQKLSLEFGFDGIYFIKTDTHGDNNSPAYYDMDAAIEFPPHNMKKMKVLNFSTHNQYAAHVLDMKAYIEDELYMEEKKYTQYKTIFPSWDNTPRKAYSGASVFFGETAELYKLWLKNSINYTRKNNSSENQFVFINAWNEWAEGAHLEPDLKYGYAYLKATREAVEETRSGMSK